MEGRSLEYQRGAQNKLTNQNRHRETQELVELHLFTREHQGNTILDKLKGSHLLLKLSDISSESFRHYLLKTFENGYICSVKNYIDVKYDAEENFVCLKHSVSHNHIIFFMPTMTRGVMGP